MVVEADYLSAEGLIECKFGGDGWIIGAKLIPKGRHIYEKGLLTSENGAWTVFLVEAGAGIPTQLWRQSG
jgi:hypothetical protein